MKVVAFDIGIVNMVFIVLERVNDTVKPVVVNYKIHAWESIAIGRPTAPSETLVGSLLAQLDTFNATGIFDDLNAVVIERQMVVKMCVLAHVVQAYFLLRTQLPARAVYIQHATRKNSCGTLLDNAGLAVSATTQATYAVYKKRSIHDAAQALCLQPDSAWHDKFHRMAKQDDFADALMHALWFAFVRRPVFTA